MRRLAGLGILRVTFNSPLPFYLSQEGEHMNITDKVAVITGGASGLGQATAEAIYSIQSSVPPQMAKNRGKSMSLPRPVVHSIAGTCGG